MANFRISQTGQLYITLADNVLIEIEDGNGVSGHATLATLAGYLTSKLKVGQAMGLATLDQSGRLAEEQIPDSIKAQWLRGSYIGKPPASTIFLQICSGLVLALKQNLSDARIVCRTPATLPMTFTLAVNNVAKGTVRFDANATQAVVTTDGDVGLTAADILSLVSPGSQDATLADICVAIPGYAP
jgi:hypothetical protein